MIAAGVAGATVSGGSGTRPLRPRSPTVVLTHALLALTLALTAADGPKPGAVVVVRAGRLFVGTGDAVERDRVIVIEGGRIATVVPADGFQAPEGARVVDLSGSTVLPGLIDCHTHLGSRA